MNQKAKSAVRLPMGGTSSFGGRRRRRRRRRRREPLVGRRLPISPRPRPTSPNPRRRRRRGVTVPRGPKKFMPNRFLRRKGVR